MQLIQIQNSDSISTTRFGEKQFINLTPQQFNALYLTRKQSHMNLNAELYIPQGSVADWSNITKVKNKGNCGSCWAFSDVDAVETLLTPKGVFQSNTLLSEQQLVDYDRRTNDGCKCGFKILGISWAIKTDLTEKKKYPYIGKQQKCLISTSQYKPSGYQVVIFILQALLQHIHCIILITNYFCQ